MSHPAGLPDLFLDRSLGRVKVPAMLREQGLRLRTLAEHYGIPADERVEDADWLEIVGTHGWLAVMKDDRIRYKTPERQALLQHKVRALVITNANLTAEHMVERIVRAIPTVARICSTRSGPFLIALQRQRIEEINLSR